MSALSSSSELHTVVSDHVVGGRIVFPAAAFVEVMRAAVLQVFSAARPYLSPCILGMLPAFLPVMQLSLKCCVSLFCR